MMSEALKSIEYIDLSEENDEENPKTFSTIVNNDDILQMYLKEIGRKKMLTRAEECELGRKIQEGKGGECQTGKECTVQFPCFRNLFSDRTS